MLKQVQHDRLPGAAWRAELKHDGLPGAVVWQAELGITVAELEMPPWRAQLGRKGDS